MSIIPEKLKGFALPKARDKRVRTSVILSQEQHDKLNAFADAQDVSVAWVIRQAVVKFLASEGNAKKVKSAKAKD